MIGNQSLQVLRFAVDDRPVCVWVHDPTARNLEFLRRFDPTYFEYIARVHAEHLAVDEKQLAALTLRVAYDHALETLFAFLCATAQAPSCIYGWLTRYKTSELYSLVRKIDQGSPILSRLRPPPVTWKKLSEAVHAHFPGDDPQKREAIVNGYARAWGRMADDFLNDTGRIEYNSLKHGLRAAVGGFSLAIGQEETPGVPLPPEKLTSLGGSIFGSTFMVLEPMFESTTNFRSVRRSRNWSPEGFVHGLVLISMSLKNIIGRLQVFSGTPPENVLIHHPSHFDAFDQPWSQSVGVLEASLDIAVSEVGVEPLTARDILSVYEDF